MDKLKKEWALGFNDRGMGHGDYGIIVAYTEELVIPLLDKELAEHLIAVHNRSLEKDESFN